MMIKKDVFVHQTDVSTDICLNDDPIEYEIEKSEKGAKIKNVKKIATMQITLMQNYISKVNSITYKKKIEI